MVKNVIITVWEKTTTFVVQAGKIIMAISILLWFMASYGPGKNFSEAEQIISQQKLNKNLTDSELENKITSFKLENSYIGILGKTIELPGNPIVTDVNEMANKRLINKYQVKIT